MALQTLSIPYDITWQRLSFASDMVDTNFGDLEVPPRWRSSLAVFGYVVPEEQTAEQYPDARILYLKLTCSITGWNPSEELQGIVEGDGVGDNIDDLQQSTWEDINADSWAKTYWPCMGAVVQIAVYPSRDDKVDVEDFPWIADFEPKRRELYETVAEGSEFLSGSSENIAVQKGTTTLDHTETSLKASAGYGIGGFGASASGSHTWSSDETVINNRNTDTSREARETKSFTTSFSQMYQLFTGYHLGSNRALFAIAPRPHTVGSSDQVDFNLIQGGRALEGIQEMFLVVHMPRQLKGFCVQAMLDTGHDAQLEPNVSYFDPEQQPDGGPERPTGGGGGGGGGGAGGADDEPLQRLVVTRRVVRSCTGFDAEDRLVALGGADVDQPRTPPVVFEGVVPAPTDSGVVARRVMIGEPGRPEPGRPERIALAARRNLYQRRVIQTMVSGLSAGTYRPRRFVDTGTFRRLAAYTLSRSRLDLNVAQRTGVLERKDIRAVGARTLGDLFSTDPKSEVEAARVAARRRVIDAVVRATQRRVS